ncbi:MAG: M23 family metallopeptidase [Firmicutes bacterium]|nr:M23 family metallopeptidase [Bacillota bacterium]
MGSIGDYKRPEMKRRAASRQSKRIPGGRLARQILAAAAFVLLVTAGIGAKNWLGDSARYVAGAGLDAGNSWLDFSQSRPVNGESDPGALLPAGAAASAGYDAALAAGEAKSQNGGAAAEGSQTEAAPETFVAPASGVVVKDMALDETGVTSEKGILIQGAAGQAVMAAAAGSVQYLGNCDSGYIVEIRHGGGYTSAYQGLSSLDVSVEQTVAAGQTIGVSDSGQLLFTLTLNGQEVDPIEYLFADNK